MTDAKTPTVNLYGEDGCAIGLTAEYDIVHHKDPEAVVRVVGHRLYVGSAEEADQHIRAAYLERAGIADPLDVR
jgi:hypothetical protein